MLYIEHVSKNKNAPHRASIKNKKMLHVEQSFKKFLGLIFLLNLLKKFQTCYY